MATRITRIYESPIEHGNVIGFSRSAGEAVADPRFEPFFADRGYSIRIMPMKKKHEGDTLIWYWEEPERLPENGVSYTYVEVQPPMPNEHIKQFGELCCRGDGGGGPMIDGGHNYVTVIDNRYSQSDIPTADMIVAIG